MNDKYDIFISYSRKDLEIVKAIKEQLESMTGAHCWMDLDGIESGDQFMNVIVSAINRSDNVLFMMSKQSMASEWALDELDFAKKKNKRLVLVSIDDAEMTDIFYFRYHKYDQIRWNNQTQREKLFRDIKSWVETTEEKTSDSKSIEEARTDSDNSDGLLRKRRLISNMRWPIIWMCVILVIILVLFLFGNSKSSQNDLLTNKEFVYCEETGQTINLPQVSDSLILSIQNSTNVEECCKTFQELLDKYWDYKFSAKALAYYSAILQPYDAFLTTNEIISLRAVTDEFIERDSTKAYEIAEKAFKTDSCCYQAIFELANDYMVGIPISQNLDSAYILFKKGLIFAQRANDDEYISLFETRYEQVNYLIEQSKID